MADQLLVGRFVRFADRDIAGTRLPTEDKAVVLSAMLDTGREA
ncbi:hypothetical protein FDG2_0569 [Candidatus Protofrankia californiensis]|uniref:Uncharacterized protein n=1 Tax=Candidatus Protofrankia californiensis TaxID=1839754 RepID=A0A1C3NTW9_9ACTN|nr:hypothetical protein [Candidatus Protofrankia californiensis]SBW18196.1 hypothetical protein FDG2_0569 [Candidatus Protofrankia californiensis]